MMKVKFTLGADNLCVSTPLNIVDIFNGRWRRAIGGPRPDLSWSEKHHLLVCRPRFISSAWGSCIQYEYLSVENLLHYIYYRKTIHGLDVDVGLLRFAILETVYRQMDNVQWIETMIHIDILESLSEWLHVAELLWLGFEQLLQAYRLHVRDSSNIYEPNGVSCIIANIAQLMSTIKECVKKCGVCETLGEQYLDAVDDHNFDALNQTSNRLSVNLTCEDWINEGILPEVSAANVNAFQNWKKALSNWKYHVIEAAECRMTEMDPLSEPDCFQEDLMSDGPDEGAYSDACDTQRWMTEVIAETKAVSMADDTALYLRTTFRPFITGDLVAD